MPTLYPCDNCPFRSDKPFRGLTKKRVIEIDQAINNDRFFSCHKDIAKEKKRACAGSIIYLEKSSLGAFANVTYRLASMRGDFTPDQIKNLNLNSTPIVASLDEFIKVATI